MEVPCPILGCNFEIEVTDTDTPFAIIVEVNVMQDHLFREHSVMTLIHFLWKYYLKYMYPSADGT